MRHRLVAVGAIGAGVTVVLTSIAVGASRTTNLDGDAGRERVTTSTRPDRVFGRRTIVRISDRCPGGSLRRVVSGRNERLQFLKVVNADTRRGKEVFFTIRSGASGRGGESRLVAWRRTGDPRVCRTPQYLFRYSIDRATRRPRGTESVAGFDVTLGERESRFPGREILLRERFVRAGEAFCCPSVTKRSFYRYDDARDGYVKYRTSVTRGPTV